MSNQLLLLARRQQHGHVGTVVRDKRCSSLVEIELLNEPLESSYSQSWSESSRMAVALRTGTEHELLRCLDEWCRSGWHLILSMQHQSLETYSGLRLRKGLLLMGNERSSQLWMDAFISTDTVDGNGSTRRSYYWCRILHLHRSEFTTETGWSSLAGQSSATGNNSELSRILLPYVSTDDIEQTFSRKSPRLGSVRISVRWTWWYKHQRATWQYTHEVDLKETSGDRLKSDIRAQFRTKSFSKASVSANRVTSRRKLDGCSLLAVGNSWEGDIALDDISLNLGPCATTTLCDFEHGMCDDWEQGPDGEFGWLRSRNGSTPSGTPTVDHTLSSALGHFLYIDPTGRLEADEAHFASPTYVASQPRCLRLWYHLYGAGQGTLRIQQKPDTTRARTLWSKSNDQGLNDDSCCTDQLIVLFVLDNIWRQARVTIPALLGQGSYRILIVGVVGAKPTGGQFICEEEARLNDFFA